MALRFPRRLGRRWRGRMRKVWVVVGDGGFQMTMCELATIVQEKINIKIAIINNGYLGMVRQWQEFSTTSGYVATPLVAPNFAALANSFGIRGETVTARKDVVPTIESARNSEQTVLINFPRGAGRFGLTHGGGRRGAETT